VPNKDFKMDFDKEVNEKNLKQNAEKIINTKLLRSSNKFKEDLDFEKKDTSQNIFSLVYKDNKAKNSISNINLMQKDSINVNAIKE
jgi:hypothetical protein